MKKALFLALLFTTSLARSQDPLFTQMTSAPQYRNPAFMGSDSSARFDIAYRDQWPKLSGIGYKTLFMGYQQYIGAINGYAGLSYVNDRVDILTEHQFSFQYAQNFRIGKQMVIRPGIQFTYLQRSIDLSHLIFPDPGVTRDPAIGDGKISVFDFSAGLLFYFHQLYLGVSAYHLTEPNIGLGSGNSPLPMRTGLQAGYTVDHPLTPSITFNATPYVCWDQQGNSNSFMAGLNLSFDKHIIVGSGYRWYYKAWLFNAGYRNKYFRIVYSYDLNTSGYAKDLGGAHEVSVGLFFWRTKAAKKFEAIILPF